MTIMGLSKKGSALNELAMVLPIDCLSLPTTSFEFAYFEVGDGYFELANRGNQ